MLINTAINNDTLIYRVKPGDNLNRIVKSYYSNISISQQQEIIRTILLSNPEIKDPNRIYPGQILSIEVPRNYCSVPTIGADESMIQVLNKTLKKASPQEQSLIMGLAPIMMGVGATGMTMVDKTFQTNIPLVTKMAENYNDYKNNKLTKGQYDYRRQKLLNQLKTKLGPTNLFLNGGKPANEILRITRKKNNLPTLVMTQQVNRMSTLSKLASRGSIILSVAGLGVACHQIAGTNDRQKKNEILFESLGGFTGGFAYGGAATVTVALMATPVGWVGALVIGLGGVIAGMASGYGAKHWYNTRGTSVDFTSLTNIDQLCK